MYLYYCEDCSFLGKGVEQKPGSKCSKCGKDLVLLPCTYEEWSSLDEDGKSSVLKNAGTREKGIKAFFSFEKQNWKSKSWTVTENGIIYGTEERIPYEEIDYVEAKKMLGQGQFNICFKDKNTRIIPYCSEQEREAQEAADFINNRTKSKKLRVNGQYIRHCKSCDKVYFFNDDDIKRNKGNQLMAAGNALSSLGRLGSIKGNQHLAIANSRLDAIVDFEKCPYCKSRDTEVFNEEDYNRHQRQINAQKSSRLQPQDPIEEVKRYKELLDQGIITQEEFETKKKKLLEL